MTLSKRLMLIVIQILSLTVYCTISSAADVQTRGEINDIKELVTKARAEQLAEQQHNKQREQRFTAAEDQLTSQKAQLSAKRHALQSEIDQLRHQFSKNEQQLANLKEQRRLEMGSLSELFSVVRQHAKELQSKLSGSVSGIDRQKQNLALINIVHAKTLPSLEELSDLWLALHDEIIASGEGAKVTIPLINQQGHTQLVPALRLGTFGVMTSDGYVNWSNTKQAANHYTIQPDNGPTLNSVSDLVTKGHQNFIVDPLQGKLISQLANQPSLTQRLSAGGTIGTIIIILLIVGLCISIVRGGQLSRAMFKVKQQLKTPHQPNDNPLGRVLNVYYNEKSRSVEALELRLLEVIIDEQSHLEKGLSMLKLLAAIAPMLGLLGTVTGMIDTFQVITQFGNSDPKVMAGGISMALVTTVLGLIAAMPILLAHNILSNQAESIKNILEKQGIGLVAQQAELDSQHPPMILAK
jgi:biopolymer transport protein ExbB